MKRLWRAATYSARGIAAAWRDEAAFRLEAPAAAALILTACLMDIDGGTRALLIVATLLPIVAELLNTAAEALADLCTGGKRHPLAAKAKDCGSAAVLISLLAAAAAWGIALWG